MQAVLSLDISVLRGKSGLHRAMQRVTPVVSMATLGRTSATESMYRLISVGAVVKPGKLCVEQDQIKGEKLPASFDPRVGC